MSQNDRMEIRELVMGAAMIEDSSSDVVGAPALSARTIDITHRCANSTMSQNDPSGDDDYDNSGFDDDLLAIDVDALVVERESQRLENMTKEIKEIVLTLAGTHAARSLPLTTEQSDTYFVDTFWMYVHKKEISNVKECVLERKTQLAVRNKKMILLDTELCRSFAKEQSNIMTDQSVLFVLCHEFIKISRSFRYSSGHLKSLPSYIRDVFGYSDTAILGKFSRVAQETLYYITGWTIHDAKRIVPRRNKDTRHALV